MNMLFYIACVLISIFCLYLLKYKTYNTKEIWDDKYCEFVDKCQDKIKLPLYAYLLALIVLFIPIVNMCIPIVCIAFWATSDVEVKSILFKKV